MQKAVLTLASIVVLSGSIISCGTQASNDLQLATGSVASEHASVATTAYAKAYSLEKAGKTRKAIKQYQFVADGFRLSPEAPKALLRAADLLYTSGQLIKSFDSHELFVSRYHGTSQYNTALKRQAIVAHAAADGSIQNNFLGLKSNIPRSKVETMLGQVRDNAPHANSAPKAQFTIGHMWESEKNLGKAIKAYEEVQVRYPKSNYAPEALYKVGTLLLKQAEKGNRNASNLNTAKTTFTDLTLLYPSSKHAASAKKKIKEINSSDIQRSFDNAEFYEKKQQNTAAIFYYREVISKTKAGSELNRIAKQRIATLSK